MKHISIRFTILFISILLVQISFATTYTTINDGAWGNTSNWVGNIVPPVESQVGDIINVNHEMTISENLMLNRYVTNISANAKISGSYKISIAFPGAKINNEGMINVATFLISFDNPTVNNYGIILVSGDMIVESGLLKNFAPTSTTDPYIEVNNLTLRNGSTFQNENIFKVNNDMLSEGPNKSNSGNLTIGNDFTIDFGADVFTNTGNVSVGGTVGGGGKVEGGGTLPIELISFKANNNQNSVELSWTTATEINNDFFTIERSMDAENWKEISFIAGAGNSNALLNYSFTDQNPIIGKQYYRLKQTDYDGSFTYSEILVVNMGEEISSAIKLYPNPTLGQLHIEAENLDKDNIFVFDVLGKEVTNKISITQSGDNQFTLDLSNLPVGMFFIKTPSATAKFFKQ